MTKLKFKATDVAELVAHSKAAEKHRAPYGIGEPVPGLFLVKDEGIYLMSNGQPTLPRKDGQKGTHVVYAQGFDPTERDRMEVWEDARAAVGGDDFAEMLPLTMFEQCMKCTLIVLSVTPAQIEVEGLEVITATEEPPEPDLSATALWACEHGAEYEVPLAIAKHPRLEDQSWHNDVSPKFGFKDAAFATVWIGHPNPELREGVHGRYTVIFDPDTISTPFREEDGKLIYLKDDPDYQEKVRQATAWLKRFDPLEFGEAFTTDSCDELLAFLDKIFALPSAAGLAKEFSKNIREALSAEQLQEVIKRNAEHRRTGAPECATHDFIDANVCMIDAWKALTLTPLDPASDEQVKIQNEAWSDASESNFLPQGGLN